MIDPRQIDLFEKYAKVRTALDKLQDQEKKLKDEILKGLDSTQKSTYGIFTPVTRVSYTYSKTTQEKEKSAKELIKEFSNKHLDEVNKLKKIEEIDGTAKAKESKTMQYRGLK